MKMSTSMKVALAAVAMVALWAARPARASNYALEEIPQAVPSADAAKLKAHGIGTTFQLAAQIDAYEKAHAATATMYDHVDVKYYSNGR